MKYGIVMRLLTVVCVAIVQLTGCSSDAEEMEKAIPDVPIRIVAEMNRGAVTSRAAEASAHLFGEWKEDYIGAEEYEKTVKHILLFAYRTSGTPWKKSFSIIPKERPIRWQM